jgi:hypothetical protein
MNAAIITNGATEREWYRNGTGAFDTSPEGVYLVPVEPEASAPDFLTQFTGVPGSITQPSINLGVAMVCKPYSEGSVKLVSPDPSMDLNVDPNFLVSRSTYTHTLTHTAW